MSRGTVWKAFGLALLCYLLLAGLFINRPESADSGSSRSKRINTFQWFAQLDINALNAYYKVRGPVPLSERLKIVGYTENTLAAFADQKIFYPFPRGWHALALRRLADAGAKVVVFDILFEESGSWDEEEDRALRDAVAYAREQGCATVLAAAIEPIDQGNIKIRTLIGPSPVIMEGQPVLGLSNTQSKLSYKLFEMVGNTLPLGTGGSDVTYYSQAAAAFQAICQQEGRDFGGAIGEADPSQTGYFLINYSTTPKSHPSNFIFFETLFPEIIDQPEPRELTSEEAASLRGLFANCAVFVGSRASADNDYFMTPLGQMFGVETNAQAFDTLLRGRYIHSVAPWAQLLLGLVLWLAAWGLSIMRPILRGAIGALGALLLMTAVLTVCYNVLRLEASFTFLSSALVLPFIVCTVYSGVVEERNKRQLRGTFSRYLSDEMVQQVLANPELANIGGGVQREAVVLFCDIRSYSTISEKMDPEKVVDMLNRFFGKVAEAILNRGGSVDKYLGDGLMASFGGMIPLEAPADNAVDAALEMVRTLYDHVHPEMKELGVLPFKIGIGLHYGDVIVGTMGHARRSDLTMIGDTVNLASRVEGMTKQYGWAIIITRDVLDALGEKAKDYDIKLVGETQVKGREQPVEMFRVVDAARPEIYEL
jgi:adenylate cyclase